MVAAAALLAAASEQRRHVVSQRAAAVLDEQTHQLAHLRKATRRTVTTPKAFLGSPPGSEQSISSVLHLDGAAGLLVFMLRRFVRKAASGDSRGSCLASRRRKAAERTHKHAK